MYTHIYTYAKMVVIWMTNIGSTSGDGDSLPDALRSDTLVSIAC